MMLGMPVVAVATSEMATVLQNGVSGFADTRVERLAQAMRHLLDDPAEARRLDGPFLPPPAPPLRYSPC
jgi:glycosyltransferase involved in cell wall biosynthesis